MQVVVHIDEPWQQEAVEEIARRFEASNPGVSVLVKVLPNGEIRSALIAGQSDADLVQLFNGDIADCARQGHLLDLRAWLGQNPDLIDLFHPSIFRLAEQEGSIAVLPLSATMKGIFYNKRWFDKAGIPYPAAGWTWDDFEKIAIRLQEANAAKDAKRFAARIPFQREYIGLLLLSAGTDWLSPDRSRASGYADSPPAIQAVQRAADLVRKHRAASATQDTFFNGDILRREAGMILDYYVMLHEIQPLLQDDLGIAGLPQFGTGQAANEPWVCGFGISSATAHPELAFSLLREMTCSANALTLLVTDGSIAALRAAYEEVGHDQDPLCNAVLAELANSAPLPISPANGLFRLLDEAVDAALGRILFEGADVKETLDELAVALDVKLQANASAPILG
ncbi:extracellular solute-binding protein [Paenibacillus sacheonensis]|uniref:Extracellular solute-binding protein n=1 Tax=Paenibacillus sacheonensis TaxID=742054 RepID=A0A7X4YM12_9BACL|nr:extracellular solute-binding protein [Paenibacillus sacheonensis]MBM7565913.1 multiple sugar transport system substrate-binding protein [Paenibacillus sacheonensis]NBC68772.1 extracellular solute-binding protein [Paenibacillus sacheonensis]